MQNLESDTAMASKHEGTFHSDHIAFEFRVVQQSTLQNLDLDLGLPGKLGLAFDELQGNVLLFLVIQSFVNLAEGSSAQLSDYLITIGYGVTDCDLGISFTVGEL